MSQGDESVNVLLRSEPGTDGLILDHALYDDALLDQIDLDHVGLPSVGPSGRIVDQPKLEGVEVE